MNTKTIVLNKLRNKSITAYLHGFIRLKTLPIEKLISMFPRSGRILSLGCGYGLFEQVLVKEKKDLVVTGCDWAKAKIDLAKKMVDEESRLEFIELNVEETDKLAQLGQYDVIFFMDVFYTLSDYGQQQILNLVKKSLKPNGYLLVKDIEKRRNFKFYFTTFQEWLAINLLHITKAFQMNFLTEIQMRKKINKARFSRVELIRLNSGYPYPHVVYKAFL